MDAILNLAPRATGTETAAPAVSFDETLATADQSRCAISIPRTTRICS